MKSIRILDCTLRDGGFVNNWKFGHDCIINILGRLDRAKIDIVEVGYLRNNAEYDKDSTEFPDTKSIAKSFTNKNYNAMLVAIIDYGKCDFEKISPKNYTIIDGIRLTFRKDEIDDALLLAEKIMQLGYKLFLQPVAITDYNSSEVVAFIEKANLINPYAVCMVDTYGFMTKQDLIRFFYLFDTTLNDNIFLGYHSHNNFQLSYANAVELIEQTSNRGLIVDATVFGIGKGAGNLNTELITSYVNHNLYEKYDVNQILEIISIYIAEEKRKHEWGYNLRYFLSALTDSHHQYANYLLSKKTLSIEAITSILSKIRKDKKTRYDEKYIENLYNEYQCVEINDENSLDSISKELLNKTILLIGPGESICEESEKINTFIKIKKPKIIAINNLLDGYKPNILFVSNAIRYSQIEDEVSCYDMSCTKIIATSNISPTSLKPDWVVNYKSLLAINNSEVEDSSALMLLRLLIKVGVLEVYVAGLDGYGEREGYYKRGIALSSNLIGKTALIKEQINKLAEHINIRYITKSKYEEL